VARIYDYLLGGKDNFAVDREAAEKLLLVYPNARIAARANRAFLVQAVKMLAQELGVRRFLDIGTGLPTSPNVNEIAHAVNPDARVVYLDNDPVVLAHADAILAGDDRTIVINHDLRDPWPIVTDPQILDHLDFSEPIALILVAVLHFVGGHAAAYEIMRILRHNLPPGSFVVITHLLQQQGRDDVEKARRVYDNANVQPVSRTREQIEKLFEGTDLVPPGLVHISDWKWDWQEAGSADPENVVPIFDRKMLIDVPLLCGIGRVPS
jgi:SAM-dependent methyltransferase